MSEVHTPRGRLGLGCDGRQHADGEHVCSRRFWPQGSVDVGELRLRAGRQGWYRGPHARTGAEVDLCPYHAPAARAFASGPGAPTSENR